MKLDLTRPQLDVLIEAACLLEVELENDLPDGQARRRLALLDRATSKLAAACITGRQR